MTETITEEKQDMILENPKHELFCQFYVMNEALFGNSTNCYAQAYDYDFDTLDRENAVWGMKTDRHGEEYEAIVEESDYEKAKNICAVQGSRLLRKVKVQNRITTLLNELMTDEMVDSQLVKVIMQDTNLPAKIQAVKAYNEVRGRIIRKTDLTSGGDKIEGVVVLPEREEKE